MAIEQHEGTGNRAVQFVKKACHFLQITSHIRSYIVSSIEPTAEPLAPLDLPYFSAAYTGQRSCGLYRYSAYPSCWYKGRPDVSRFSIVTISSVEIRSCCSHCWIQRAILHRMMYEAPTCAKYCQCYERIIAAV